MQTCEFISEALSNVPCTFDASVRERSLGVLEGLLRSDAAMIQPEALSVLSDGAADARVPGVFISSASRLLPRANMHAHLATATCTVSMTEDFAKEQCLLPDFTSNESGILSV